LINFLTKASEVVQVHDNQVSGGCEKDSNNCEHSRVVAVVYGPERSAEAEWQVHNTDICQ
jgi:hypothetical protein